MRKLLLIACLFTLALTGCKNNKTADLAGLAQNDSLNKVIAQKDNEINDMMGTFNEIEEGFRQINDAENRVNLAKSGEGANRSRMLKENVQFSAKRMQANRELINKLREQLKGSSLKGEQFKKAIENLLKELTEKDKQLQKLREELDSKDIHISELDETINNLNTNVSNLNNESAAKSQMISQQDKQLNTAWYVFGTKKELKDQHILEGGKVLNSSFNKNYFTKIDIRVDKQIKLYSKSARLLTAHPSSSYTLTRDNNKQFVLTITNPQLFWSTSKYLVILVK
jgi:chromosome segregation ATPase